MKRQRRKASCSLGRFPEDKSAPGFDPSKALPWRTDTGQSPSPTQPGIRFCVSGVPTSNHSLPCTDRRPGHGSAPLQPHARQAGASQALPRAALPHVPQPGHRTYLLLLLLLNVSRAVCWQLPFCRPLFALLFFPTLFFWERETKVSWELREGTRSGGSSPLRGGRPWCVSGRIQTPAVPRGEGRAPPQG